MYFVYLLRSQRIKKNQEIKELLQKELEFSEIDQNSLTNYDSVQYDDFRRKIIEKYIEERSWMKFVKFEHKGVWGINKIQYYFNFMNKQIWNELKQNEKIVSWILSLLSKFKLWNLCLRYNFILPYILEWIKHLRYFYFTRNH